MIDVVKKVWEYKASKQRVYPCHTNRVSILGHPCERYLVYMRVAWDKLELPSIDREFIFEGGRVIEELALQELKDAGYEVTNQGRDFFDKAYNIAGHIDCFISEKGNSDPANSPIRYPCEIKGISPFYFDKINTLEDMTKSENSWTRAYPAQLQLYLFLTEKEEGLFYIKSKLTFKPKQIWTKLDYNYVESILQRCERINKCVAENTLPKRLDEYKTCKNCAAKALCRPDIMFGDGIGFLDDKELISFINRRAKIAETALEYKNLDKQVKEGLKSYMKDREVLLVGDWTIEKKVAKNGSTRFDISKNGTNSV
jgi:hypothetical protein